MVWRCIILHRCLVIAVKGTSCTSAASSKEHQHQDARKPNTDTRKPRPHPPAVFSAFSPFLLFLQIRWKRFVTLQLLSIKSAQCLCTAEKKLVVQLSIKTGGRHKMRLHWKSSSWFLICRIVLLFEPSADAARRPAGWCSLAFKVWRLIAATSCSEYQPRHLNGPEMTEDKSWMCWISTVCTGHLLSDNHPHHRCHSFVRLNRIDLQSNQFAQSNTFQSNRPKNVHPQSRMP